MQGSGWKRWLLCTAAAIGSLLLAVAGLLWWAHDSLELDAIEASPVATGSYDLRPPATPVGRILAVVSSRATMAHDGRKAGYELTELSRAWAVFVANGYDVDIASPEGGEAPMKLDEELLDLDRAFLADPVATARRQQTLRLAEVDPADYVAVYFVGGKGTLWDFADNPEIARIGSAVWAAGGVLAAVCHGPAALLSIRDVDGQPLLAGRRVTAFSNAEELFLIPEAGTVLPFLLEDRLRAAGARFVEGPMYLDHSISDGRLVTGQNPWSSFSTAEAVVRALGREPLPRMPNTEEGSVRVLLAWHHEGMDAARLLRTEGGVDRRLLAMHAVIALMQLRLWDALQLHELARPWPGDEHR